MIAALFALIVIADSGHHQVYKLTQPASLFHQMSVCNDSFNAMSDDGAFQRLKAAHAAGAYDAVDQGGEVVVTSGNVDQDLFVMVKTVHHNGYGCVASAWLKPIH
jgi:hypothetical protein